MPDLSMCTHLTCPQRLKCYRYRATPSRPQQDYSDYPGGPGCDGFTAIRSSDRLISTDELRTREERAKGKRAV
jgi:hypothetical protein